MADGKEAQGTEKVLGIKYNVQRPVPSDLLPLPRSHLMKFPEPAKHSSAKLDTKCSTQESMGVGDTSCSHQNRHNAVAPKKGQNIILKMSIFL